MTTVEYMIQAFGNSIKRAFRESYVLEEKILCRMGLLTGKNAPDGRIRDIGGVSQQ